VSNATKNKKILIMGKVLLSGVFNAWYCIFDLKSKIKGFLILHKIKINFIFGSSNGIGDQ
jgi:hypothetical protein